MLITISFSILTFYGTFTGNLHNVYKRKKLQDGKHYGVPKPYAINYIKFQYSGSESLDEINGLVDLNEFKSSIFINLIPIPIPVPSIINIVVQSFKHKKVA